MPLDKVSLSSIFLEGQPAIFDYLFLFWMTSFDWTRMDQDRVKFINIRMRRIRQVYSLGVLLTLNALGLYRYSSKMQTLSKQFMTKISTL